MSEQNFSEMTVIELRKLAKEMHVPLRAGISKQGIIDRLTEEANSSGAPAPEAEAESPAEPSKAEESEEAAEAPAAPEKDVPAPGFRQSAAPRFNTKPAYQAPAFSGRGSAPRPSVEPQRTQTTRPVGFVPRFGPAAQEPSAAPREEERPIRTEPLRIEAARPAFNAERPAPAPERPAYSADRRPAYEAPRYPQRSAYEPRPTGDSPARPAPEQRPVEARPAVSEMLTPAECPEGSGVLEMHPDGYGFLRTESLLPTAKDIFVAAAQVKRFGLRAGDLVKGKIRPMRDGDKYSAMLYLTSVNDAAPDALANRAAIEDLSPIYPTRRIRLASAEGKTPDDLRLMDLCAPIGFGQRGLIIAPTGADTRDLMVHLATAIAANHPTAQITALLFNETPEEVTCLRDQVSCPVLASTFDMVPEHHLRLADLAVESALRQAEMKRDVVLLVDSLTALAHVFTTAAMQQGRQQPGAISPASLQKAKRLFGAARCLREGGSLTVIAVMTSDPANKLEEALVADFRSAANMELVLTASSAVDVSASGTKHAELIASASQLDSLKLIHQALRENEADKFIPELLDMMASADSPEGLLQALRDRAENP